MGLTIGNENPYIKYPTKNPIKNNSSESEQKYSEKVKTSSNGAHDEIKFVKEEGTSNIYVGYINGIKMDEKFITDPVYRDNVLKACNDKEEAILKKIIGSES
ncbi:hypothetical protein [Clostridium scatologenes]|uniref:Uncharacterized protein n=1 Tax=Clostridium scatologenes TaxID=1548 RepID=A0A0E3GRJ6_CLOSL|nr:hypothetical protein [Clostridium scatologenes]AKA70436.1 hypothetical protein CSCA_3311 [Clostridium scatologenes]